MDDFSELFIRSAQVQEDFGGALRVVNARVVRPPLRWAGSKRKSLSVLKSHVPSGLTRYVEPFAGSACLAFSLTPTSIVLGDINPKLIDFYKYLKSDPHLLHNHYISIPRNPVTYYETREIYNKSLPSLYRAAQFLYLNRHCFNGIYRVNTQGAFNVPWGGDKVGNPLSREELVIASESLSEATLLCGDFEKIVLDNLESGVFVYLDPPYANDETRVFREYHEKSFATCDWERLWSLMTKIDQAGGKFLLSYAGAAPLEARFSNWNVGHLDVTRNVGGFKSTRRKYREFVATNYLPQA